MAEESPEIYLFDGDDEFAINESIEKICSRLGERNIAEMNITRLDGRSFSFTELKDAAATVPFLAPKRLVILSLPTSRMNEKSQQDELINYLSTDKPTSKLLLVEYDFLTNERDRKDGKVNWLEKWATSPSQAKRVYVRHHPQPGGPLMVKWIEGYAKKMDGQITPQAAVALANLIGDDTLLASQEITKLLTYLDYSQPIDTDDVEYLTPSTAKIGDFDLINALRVRDQRKAQALLHKSLQDLDPGRIFQSIVFQIRTLIIAREILDNHGTVDDFPKSLKIGYYPAKLALESAGHFSGAFLDDIYHRLLNLDAAMKMGQMDADVALEMLVIELTI